jgi:hypothetical protein
MITDEIGRAQVIDRKLKGARETYPNPYQRRSSTTLWGKGLGVLAGMMMTALFFTVILFSVPSHASTGASKKTRAADPHPSDIYFALDHVLDVSIEIEPQAWDRLRTQTRSFMDIVGGADCLESPPADIFSWFQATVRVDGETHTQVGIRKKGFLGSLQRDEKPGLKLRFDKFVDNQLLGGVMKRLTLNNVPQDRSMLNTCMAYHIFAAAGLPTPRCNFATVSVNGENLGLYVHVESIKTPFIERHFPNTQGNLYEGALSDFRPDWHGTFKKKSNESEADWSDIHAVIDALEDPSSAGLEALADQIDLDLFLTFWATEVLVAHWDGYSGNKNNFYIYRRSDGRFVFIPWGADDVLSSNDVPIFDTFRSPLSVNAHGAIAHHLYQEETTRQLYVDRLKEVLDLVWDEDELVALLDQMAAIVQTHALASTRTNAAGAAAQRRSFIRGQRARILADIEPQPPEWPWPLTTRAEICWPRIGVFDLVFDTTWGSHNSEEPLEEGAVTITNYQLNGEEQHFSAVGATAGGGRLKITGLAADLSVDVLSVGMSPSSFKSGSHVVFRYLFGTKGLHTVSPPSSPRAAEPIGLGGIEFYEASTEVGAKVSGRFYGTIFSTNKEATDFSAEIEAAKNQQDNRLIINEVAAQGEPLDWFELYNATDDRLDLGGFVLADDLANINKRVPFPDGVFIEAGGYQKIELDKDGWPGFALGSDEELGIWTIDGILVDRFDWAKSEFDAQTSLARLPDITGDFQTVDNPTPGVANQVRTAVVEQAANGPRSFQLHDNWPNPFNATTIIAFDLAVTMPVDLVVYDVLGRRIRALHNGKTLVDGQYRIAWDGLDDQGRPVASGVYLYQLVAGEAYTAVGRMALIR